MLAKRTTDISAGVFVENSRHVVNLVKIQIIFFIYWMSMLVYLVPSIAFPASAAASIKRQFFLHCDNCSLEIIHLPGSSTSIPLMIISYWLIVVIQIDDYQ